MKNLSFPLRLAILIILTGAILIVITSPLDAVAQGNVGIGTINPSEKLDVDGNIRLSGEIMPDGDAGTSGQLLKSNGDGSMSWTDASGLNGGVGYGTWGDCEMAGLSEYSPVCDPLGESYDGFGQSVSMYGNFAVVGASADDAETGYDQGSATVFLRDWNTGQWVKDGNNKLMNPGAESEDRFGYSVAIHGYYLVVGTPYDHESAGGDQGSISIFKRNAANGIWELQGSKITNTNASPNDRFGLSVSITDNFVIAGAPLENGLQGSVSIFFRNPSDSLWYLDGSKIIDQTGSAEDRFGLSVSISGYYAIVGAPFDDNGANTDQGSVSIYERDAGLGWVFKTKMFSPSGSAYDSFGGSVCIDGDYAIVGATGVGPNDGAAYVLKRDTVTGTWDFFGDPLTHPDGATGLYFGTRVSIAGNYAMVSCPTEDSKGSVTLFVNVGLSFQGFEKITDPWGKDGDDFGYRIDVESYNQRFIISSPDAFNGGGKVVFGKF